jgi:hypothetical protein
MARMRLFRRDARPGEPAAAIASFWDWWASTGRDAVTSAIEAREPERVADELNEAVGTIHPDLAWEVGAGDLAQHVLVVTAEGDPELRPLASRWLRSCPAVDETWEYAASRQPSRELGDIVLGIGDREVAFCDIRVGARREGVHLEVSVYHPLFVDLDEQLRAQVAFLALDAALGEDDVEAWVGEISCTTEPPLDGFPLTGLRSVVRDLHDDNTADDGTPNWVVMEAQGAEGPVMALAQVPLSPVTAPTLDTHVAVLVPYTDVTEQGYPGPGSLGPLRALEDHLTERISGSGRIVAHQSHRGMRVLHIYVDSTTPAVEQMRAAVDAWDQGRIRVQVTSDPGWHNVAHLRA